ncbi:FAS1 domain-containing protein [Moelleriella libera RCEF 2490]|uniref:FAS1 domain-containing protein n=1 Tax=Moelleriella libera RCEF 2490 TaxID=1081109 RepID=A0A166U3E3_9HYPO|nr:FAS1 domain-containing protein [Moelleriella libera RCEF 2490]
MRRLRIVETFALILSLSYSIASVLAVQLQKPMMPPSSSSSLPPPPRIKFASSSHQPSDEAQSDTTTTASTKVQPAVSLADIIGPQRSISSFSSFSRLSQNTADALSNRQTNLTVLAPLNSAIDEMSRKPWVDAGGSSPESANHMIESFVKAHLVAKAPWKEGDRAKTLAGNDEEIWWEERHGKRVIMPDGIEVDRVASQVANGELVSTLPFFQALLYMNRPES